MSHKQLSCDVVRINGMTCTSCEVLIERALKTIPGVHKVNVNHTTGACKIYTEPGTVLRLSEINEKIADKGYTVELTTQKSSTPKKTNTEPNQRMKWREFGVMLLVVFAVYSVLKSLGVFSIAQTVDSSFSYGAVFVIGLVAATSTCIAVVGGLILTVTARYNEAHASATSWEKFRPHLLFNIGRLVSYFVLGGVIGLIGKALTPSTRFTGYLTIAIAIVMVLLGLDILKLFKTKSFIPRMPKALSHRIHALAESEQSWGSLLLGALTFFLPCGFTQSMQLYALTTGSFWKGGLTMLVFAIGTLPALLGIGMVSSYSKGKAARYFLQFSGVLVLVLGLYNFNNGLALAGINPGEWFSAEEQTAEGLDAEIVDGVQVVRMAVDGLDYLPSTITIQAGMPVEWRIDGSRAAGCASVITIPKLGVTEFLSDDETVVTFTPTQTGTLPFTCGMGMTSGRFIVVDPNTNS